MTECRSFCRRTTTTLASKPKLDDLKKLKCLFEPFPDSELIAYHVNPIVNNSRHDAADCIESTEKHSTKCIQVKWKPWESNPKPSQGDAGMGFTESAPVVSALCLQRDGTRLKRGRARRFTRSVLIPYSSGISDHL